MAYPTSDSIGWNKTKNVHDIANVAIFRVFWGIELHPSRRKNDPEYKGKPQDRRENDRNIRDIILNIFILAVKKGKAILFSEGKKVG